MRCRGCLPQGHLASEWQTWTPTDSLSVLIDPNSGDLPKDTTLGGQDLSFRCSSGSFHVQPFNIIICQREDSMCNTCAKCIKKCLSKTASHE